MSIPAREPRPRGESTPSWGCTHGTPGYLTCVLCWREATEEQERVLLREALEKLTAVLDRLLGERS